MKAVIMAGGEGTRLRPITCTMPKPMVPILNKPIIDYVLELIKKHGIGEAAIALHYMGDVIKNHVDRGQAFGLGVTFSDPGTKVGTAGSVRAAVGDTNEPVLVLSGDGITDIDLTDAIQQHKKAGADATIVLTRVDEPSEYGIALVDDAGFIKRFIEKPERSEVFSDYANTGIYVLEPSAIELIPKDKDFDFSKDLFPLMMEKGMKLFGYKTDAYWCDVGDIAQYRRAQYDMLDGLCAFSTIAKCDNGIFIEPNAYVDPSARLAAPCYIGSGAIIAKGARISAHTVVGSNAVIERDASIKRSIIFEKAHIRQDSQLREAVICERARIDERVDVFSGSTVGAGSHIGRGVTLLQNVAVWPEKEIESGARLESNLMWGSSAKRAEFSGSTVKGRADTSLTPEAALRVGAAFASRLKPPARLAVATDGSAAAVMLKYALLSGVASQGVDAASAGAMSRSELAFFIEHSGYDGGIYAELRDGREAELTILESDGLAAAGGTMRALRTAFLIGEQRPALHTELGLITGVNGMEAAYERRLMSFVDKKTMMLNKKTLRLSAPEQMLRIVIRTVLQLGWDAESAADRARLTPAGDDETLSILVDENNMLSAAAGRQTIADAEMLITVLAEDVAAKGETKTLVMPVSLDEAYREYLKKQGFELRLEREDRAGLIRSSRQTGLDMTAVYDPEAAIMRLANMFAENRLVERLAALPETHRSEAVVDAAWSDTGRMLRALSEEEGEREGSELVDGLRLKFDSGWVIVQPNANRRASFRIVAGSMDSEYADELCNIYTDKLKRIRDNKNEK